MKECKHCKTLNPDDYIYNEEYFYVLNSKSIYDIYFMFIASVETFTEYYVDADPDYSYHLDRIQFTCTRRIASCAREIAS